jgi:hypothetical protein
MSVQCVLCNRLRCPVYARKSKNQTNAICLVLLNALLLLGDQALSLQRSHTATACGRDRLAVPLILNITCCKNALHTCLRGSRDGNDVAIGVGLQLSANKRSRRLVANSVEETGNGEIFLLSSEGVLDTEVVKEVTVTLALDSDGVPEDSDFGVIHQALGHDLGGTELAPSYENVDVGAILGQI